MDRRGLIWRGGRLQGHAQTLNRGADVFLADERGEWDWVKDKALP